VFNIGEFSKITGLTVKTLRFYHEQGLLEPTSIDEQTGYRYYAANKIETAQVIQRLRQLDVPLADIKEILQGHGDDADLVAFLEQHRRTIQTRLQQYRDIDRQLTAIIQQAQEARTHMQENYQIEEKTVDSFLIAGVRMRGKYSECGKGFSQIGKQFGRYICGNPFLLHYDSEYKEDDADFEACMPVRQGTSKNDVAVRPLSGGRCVALIHKGTYEEMGRSYARILEYAKRHGYSIATPTREVYLKGPGMIFRGNPKKYLTEIQLLIEI
jgi:DNA-binding transcriptional MerR regulator/effector-binding domain-containing protein